jgi:hypothetical protein
LTIEIRIITGFRETEGLQQECGLSQTLFKIYLELVLYDWNKQSEVWNWY